MSPSPLSVDLWLILFRQFFIDLEGYGSRFLHGAVPDKDRMPMVDEFQQDPEVYIFLISTLTGGVCVSILLPAPHTPAESY
jgi:hypothetical protein